MAKGAILTTTSVASLCLFLLGACSTSEEVPAETAAVPVEDPRPLPPPDEAPRSRLLIASTEMPGAGASSSVEAQEVAGTTAAPTGQSEASSEPAPPVPSPRPAAAEQPLDDAEAPSAPPPKPQQTAEGVSLEEPPEEPPEEPVEDAPEPEPEEQEPEIAADAEEEEPQAAATEDVAVPEAAAAPEDGSEATAATDALESNEQAIELEEVEPEAQQAALPQADPPERLRLQFDAGEVELTEPMQNQLMEIAQQLREHEEERVQLLAYASGHEEDISRARRLSLARALAVRAFLLDQGVRSTRMDVRALARSEGGAPPDRVDVVPQSE